MKLPSLPATVETLVPSTETVTAVPDLRASVVDAEFPTVPVICPRPPDAEDPPTPQPPISAENSSITSTVHRIRILVALFPVMETEFKPPMDADKSKFSRR
jgi:hypothetical protein